MSRIAVRTTMWRPGADWWHMHANATDAFKAMTPPRPDLKEPQNRTWLKLDRYLPAPPEYFPTRRHPNGA